MTYPASGSSVVHRETQRWPVQQPRSGSESVVEGWQRGCADYPERERALAAATALAACLASTVCVALFVAWEGVCTLEAGGEPVEQHAAHERGWARLLRDNARRLALGRGLVRPTILAAVAIRMASCAIQGRLAMPPRRRSESVRSRREPNAQLAAAVQRCTAGERRSQQRHKGR